MRVQGWRKAGAWRGIQRDGFTLDSLSAECAVWHPLWGEMALPGEWGLSPSQGPASCAQGARKHLQCGVVYKAGGSWM